MVWCCVVLFDRAVLWYSSGYLKLLSGVVMFCCCEGKWCSGGNVLVVILTKQRN